MGLIQQLSPILVMLDDVDGYYLQRSWGELVLPSEVQKIIDGLQDFCLAYTDEEIQEYNRRYNEQRFNSYNTDEHKSKKRKRISGYVYVLRCADKYKFGYSKDVEKRIAQLDTRPFKLELVLKGYSENAYNIEQKIHDRLQAYKADGEWYQDLEWTVEEIKLFIDETARCIGCEIQY